MSEDARYLRHAWRRYAGAMRHTSALRYSRWERLVFRLTGRWPQRVVDRRLAALEADEREARSSGPGGVVVSIEHAERIAELTAERDRLREALGRATYVAEHLFQMVSASVWRHSGGDDGQGHYEGDYHAEQVHAEIESWKALTSGPEASRVGYDAPDVSRTDQTLDSGPKE